MDWLQFIDAHMGIDLRGREITVTQHHLDKAQTRPIIQHVRGHSMAEQVTHAGFIDLGMVQIPLHQAR